jgi:hypothetical protein
VAQLTPQCWAGNMPHPVDPLYEEFVVARSQAIALADEYASLLPGQPGQRELWTRVVAQTDYAYHLLKRWLARKAHGLSNCVLDEPVDGHC